MIAPAAIDAALRAAGLPASIVSMRDLSGGCVHHVIEVILADGRALVAKCSSNRNLGWFEQERASLDALAATSTVRVPQALAVVAHGSSAVLLMTAIPPGRADDRAWRQFGRELAALHAAPTPGRGYGFDHDNHLGSTPQPNAWRDDWVEFNAVNRLGHQVRLARRANLLSTDESRRIEAVISRLDRLIPRRPRPALLHGDLWSGNALPAVAPGRETGGGRIAVIDPACSIGDGWADIAMMRLFGGFPDSCFDEYAANINDHDDIAGRIAVYQLYHLLNHLNLFGRGYAAQAMSIAARLGG